MHYFFKIPKSRRLQYNKSMLQPQPVAIINIYAKIEGRVVHRLSPMGITVLSGKKFQMNMNYTIFAAI